MGIKILSKKFYLIDSEKIIALFFCLFVLFSLNAVPLRIILSLPRSIFAFLFSVIAFVMAYGVNGLAIVKYRLGLFLVLFILTVYFYFPLFGHPLNINYLILFSGILPVLFFKERVYYILFRYLRKVILFVSICSLIIFFLLFLFPENSIPFPSFDMEPISMAHIKGGISYRVYLFVVTYIGYDNVFFSALGVSRICGFMSEPGHWGVLLAFILIAELFLYGKRSWILILCGLCTFSTAFYLILVIMELYLIFFERNFKWKRYSFILLSLILIVIMIGPEMRQSIWDMVVGRNIDADKSLDDRTSSMGMMIWNHFLTKTSVFNRSFGFSPFALEMKGAIIADYRAMIYDLGFVGTVFVVFSFLFMVVKMKLKQAALILAIAGLIFVHRVWMFYMPYMYVFIIMINFANSYYKNANKAYDNR